ncbi:MarR family winged helix-turn-helix transcriptional regulator [Paenibacillus sp. Y412MC10]|uniref:MarR family winged helix-turn-helix transcriptional regulator n=1 Tax=Geobacillus sp. (strain Y412MC10) TaxID=481743 RepID=UPI0011AB889A|nr:MarR family transcriptional regulator [Paenibacillus sp. Y412MC10]
MIKLTEDELAAWRSFIKTHALIIDFIEKELATEKKVPLTSYDVLIALFEAPGKRLRMHELASKVVLSRSGLTRLVDRLEKQGLIVRERSDKDRRAAYAVLTREGKRELLKAWPIYARGIHDSFISGMNKEELATIHHILENIMSRLGKTSDLNTSITPDSTRITDRRS